MNTLPYRDKIVYKSMNTFGGITNANLAGDGDIIDMTNMSSDKYPHLSPIAPRGMYEQLNFNASAMCFFDGKPLYACSGALVYNGTVYSELTEGKKQLAVFDDKVCIFPDKVVIKRIESYLIKDKYTDDVAEIDFVPVVDIIDIIGASSTLPDTANEGDRFLLYKPSGLEVDEVLCSYTSGVWVEGSIITPHEAYRLPRKYIVEQLEVRTELKYSSSNISSRRLVLESMENDTLLKITASEYASSWVFKPFSVGDSISITGLGETVYDETYSARLHCLASGTLIHEKGDDYIIVTNVSGECIKGSSTPREGQKVVFARHVPDFDCVCVVNNRLWGSAGSTIYASALGRPEQYSYNTISTSAWAVDTVGENFTACTCYDGAPVFFKENAIYKIYGDTPSEFGFRTLDCAGVKSGARDTLAQCQGALYYESALGVMRYSGGYPTPVSHELGGSVNGVVGGSDGVKYYLSCEGTPTYVYDARYGTWHKEIGAFNCFATYYSDTYAVEDAKVYIIRGSAEGDDSGAKIPSTVTFADIHEGTLYRKQYNKIRLRAEVESGELLVLVGYDGDRYDEVLRIEAGSAKNIYIKDLVPQRCDNFKLKLFGTGMYTVYAIDREYAVGSDLG